MKDTKFIAQNLLFCTLRLLWYQSSWFSIIQGVNQRGSTLSCEEKQIQDLFPDIIAHSGSATASDVLWPTCDHHGIFSDHSSQRSFGSSEVIGDFFRIFWHFQVNSLIILVIFQNLAQVWIKTVHNLGSSLDWDQTCSNHRRNRDLTQIYDLIIVQIHTCGPRWDFCAKILAVWSIFWGFFGSFWFCLDFHQWSVYPLIGLLHPCYCILKQPYFGDHTSSFLQSQLLDNFVRIFLPLPS